MITSDAAEAPTHETSLPNLACDVLGALLLASSVSMLTDFSRRLLSADPDSIGIASISVQAVFAVAATGTFSKTGWRWIESLLSKLKMRMQSPSHWRLALSATLFAIVCPAWICLPPWLASYYNDRGESLEETNPPAALEDLERSTTLDPQLSAAQYNLGELLEQSYQYEAAALHYQQSIAVNNRDVNAYNNLGRVLLIAGKTNTALGIIDRALAIGTTNKHTLASLYANRGAAEFELGFSTEAIGDAYSSENAQANAAAYCLLGKTYTKIGRPFDAHAAWDEFSKEMTTSDPIQMMAPPDCTHRSEEAHATN